MKIQFNTRRQKDPTRDQGLKVPYAPAKRRLPQWRWYLILLVVSSPLLYFIYNLVSSQVIISAPGLITLEKIPINSASTGYVSKIHISVGETISKGKVLVDLGSPALDEKERVLKAELDHPDPSLPPLGLRMENLLRNRVKLAKKNAAYQKKKLGEVRFLFDQGAATIAEVNQAEAMYDQARFTLNQSRSELTAQQEKIEKEKKQPEAKQASRRQQIQAELETIRDQRKRLQQRAPFPGRILDIYIQENQTLSQGASILLMGRIDHPYIIAYLDPKYTKYAIGGNQCTVKLPNGKSFRAQVRKSPTLTRRLPSDLSSPLGDRELKILVKLDFLSPISSTESIDGLPVTVHFDLSRADGGTAVGKIWSRLRRLFR